MRMQRRTLLAAAPAMLAMPRLARAAERTNIAVWHSMAASPGDEFSKLIARFNASQDRVEAAGVFKGVYKDTLTAIAAAWRAGAAPHIAQVYEVGTETMLPSGSVIRPLWQLAQETGVRLDADAYIPAVRGYYSNADGKLMSAPFNSSTAICWYNQDAFKKAGLDPAAFPATWPELVALARTIRDRGVAEYPVITASITWAHFEQFSAIHDLPYATLANGFDGYGARLRIDSSAHAANLERLLDMAKEGTFHYTGRDGSGDGAFVAGRAAIDFSSSALRSMLASDAKFRWAAAYLPYDPLVIRQPINSVIGGASLWVLTAPGRSEDEYRAAAQFLRFLAQPGNDAEWSEATGYVPITHAGFEKVRQQGYYQSHPGADLPVLQLQPRHGHRKFARLPPRPHAGNPHHHRGGMRAGAGRPARRAQDPAQRGGARQPGAARFPAIGRRLSASPRRRQPPLFLVTGALRSQPRGAGLRQRFHGQRQDHRRQLAQHPGAALRHPGGAQHRHIRGHVERGADQVAGAPQRGQRLHRRGQPEQHHRARGRLAGKLVDQQRHHARGQQAAGQHRGRRRQRRQRAAAQPGQQQH